MDCEKAKHASDIPRHRNDVGLEHKLGHRVIEVGCVEMVNRRLTNRHFHHYLNPDRDIDAGALAVHGISLDFLQDKPRFAEIAEEFLDFVRGAELIIHNASFDIGLNAELASADMASIETICHGILDSLRLAKENGIPARGTISTSSASATGSTTRNARYLARCSTRRSSLKFLMWLRRAARRA